MVGEVYESDMQAEGDTDDGHEEQRSELLVDAGGSDTVDFGAQQGAACSGAAAVPQPDSPGAPSPVAAAGVARFNTWPTCRDSTDPAGSCARSRRDLPGIRL